LHVHRASNPLTVRDPGSRARSPPALHNSTASTGRPRTQTVAETTFPNLPSLRRNHTMTSRVSRHPVATGHGSPTHHKPAPLAAPPHYRSTTRRLWLGLDTRPSASRKGRGRRATGTLSWYWRDDLSGKTNPQRLYAIQVPLNPEKYQPQRPASGPHTLAEGEEQS